MNNTFLKSFVSFLLNKSANCSKFSTSRIIYAKSEGVENKAQSSASTETVINGNRKNILPFNEQKKLFASTEPPTTKMEEVSNLENKKSSKLSCYRFF